MAAAVLFWRAAGKAPETSLLQRKVEFDELNVVHVPYSRHCASTRHNSNETKCDECDSIAGKTTSVHVDTSLGYQAHKQAYPPGNKKMKTFQH
ncbi:hypothetical protein YC2023_033579 [Brassica napus]